MSGERPERLLKPREFCEIVGINYQTFKRWVHEGKVHIVRVRLFICLYMFLYELSSAHL